MIFWVNSQQKLNRISVLKRTEIMATFSSMLA